MEREALALWLELREEEQKDCKVTKEKLVVNMMIDIVSSVAKWDIPSVSVQTIIE